MMGSDHFLVFRDEAGAWGAAPPGFRDIALDPTGWGDTAWAAIDDLLRHPEFQDGVKASKWPMPAASDFVEVQEPVGARTAKIEYETVLSANIEAAIRRQSFRVISND
jgi:hypothetical protein